MDLRSTDASLPERPPYRPPIGMPISNGDWWRGPLVSILLHAGLILLLLAPAIVAKRTLLEAAPGAGGPGPAGGGGGGTGGTGGRPLEERLQYIDIAPEAIPAAIPDLPTPLPEPVIVPPPEPVIVPPPPTPPPAPPVPEPKVEAPPAAVAAAAAAPPSAIPGTGGGSGNDGTAGMGPGSGGGVGTGIGTGRGSGLGPGTGGGDGGYYAPTPKFAPLPPSNIPERLRPYTVVALFDVDEKGRVIKFEFNESRDREFNKQVRAVLATVTFRPGTTPEGKAIRATAKIEFTVY